MATLEQAKEQIEENGARLPDGHPIADGKFHRYGPKKKYWYRLHEIAFHKGSVAIVGSFGCWQGDNENTQNIAVDWTGISAEDRASAEQKRKALDEAEAARKQQEAANAAIRASQQWSAASPEGASPYVERKKITAPGVRYQPDGTMLIPMVVFEGAQPRLVGLQKIQPDGAKRYSSGMAKQGACCPIGKIGPDDKILFIAEGYATARSVRLGTEDGVGGYVSFDAGNIQHVAAMARARHPDAHVLICADDDFLLEKRYSEWLASEFKLKSAVPIDGAEHRVKATDGADVCVIAAWRKDARGVDFINVDVRAGRRIKIRTFENAGVSRAAAAARSIGNASIVCPKFANRGENKWTDFNDLHVEESLDAVREQLAAAIMKVFTDDSAADTQIQPENDALYDEALAIVRTNKRVSISLLQRHLRVGYNRAARLVESMEQAGAITAPDASGVQHVIPSGSVATDDAGAANSAAAAAGEAPPPWAGEGEGEPVGEEDIPWERKLARSEKGNILPTLANVYHILRNSPKWTGVIAYDEFSGQVVKLKPPPFVGGAELGEWSDMDDTRCTLWMGQQYSFSPRKEVVMDAVLLIADANKYHVVRSYLDPLVWDKQPRCERWLVEMLGAEDTPYNRVVARKWLIAAVARVYRPGCKADNVLILEGEQGLYKSTALKVLGGEWFTDAPFRLGDKDAYVVIRGKWIVELAELDSFNKAESTGAKLFFGQYIDRYRNFYGKRASDVPRQQVFAGTTNSDAYLKDDTGNRRYWPVKVHRIDLEGLKEWRDQLWAEAVDLFRAGAEWWPTSAEKEMFESEQDERYVGDAYIGVIQKYLVGKTQCTMEEILGDALKLDIAKWTRPEQQRIGRCMSEMGWKRKRDTRIVDGKRPWVYLRPVPAAGAQAEVEDDPL